jgi:hypothetical protein
MKFNPLRMEDFFCHQNQNSKNIGNFTTPLKSHNIGTPLKGMETSFQMLPLYLKYFHFWASYITFCNFLKIPSVFKGLFVKKSLKLTVKSKKLENLFEIYHEFFNVKHWPRSPDPGSATVKSPLER